MSRSSQRVVEQDELRARMRAVGMSHDEIAIEFARRYRLRPRTAHRVAHGWTQQQAAGHLNAHAARIGLDSNGAAPTMTSPKLSELENWPLPDRRRPTPQVLALLAEVYDTSVHNLIDLDDRENMPLADLMVISKIGKRLPPVTHDDADDRIAWDAILGSASSPRTTGIAVGSIKFPSQLDPVSESYAFDQLLTLGVADPTKHWVELLSLVAGKVNDSGAGPVWSLAHGQLAVLDACRRTSMVGGHRLLAVQARWSSIPAACAPPRCASSAKRTGTHSTATPQPPALPSARRVRLLAGTEPELDPLDGHCTGQCEGLVG